MKDEILRIQKMVAEGRITPEEGAELIASVGSAAASPAASAPPPAKSGPKALGIISLVVFGLGVILLPLAVVVAYLFVGTNSSSHSS